LVRSGETSLGGHSRGAPVPAIIVVLPIEGDAVARIVSSTYEEELRAGLEVFDRATILQLASALGRLRQALIEREEAA
jgi:hypothetical protein